MSKPRVGFIVFVAVLLAVVILSLTGQVRKLVQVDEMEGHRQKEYKALGLIPWGFDREDDPNVHVKADGLAALGTWVKSPKEIDLSKSNFVLRTLRGHQVQYCTRMDFKGDAEAVVAFYEKQLTDVRKSASDEDILVSGRTADGTKVMVSVSSVYASPHGAPVGKDFLLKVTRD